MTRAEKAVRVTELLLVMGKLFILAVRTFDTVVKLRMNAGLPTWTCKVIRMIIRGLTLFCLGGAKPP